MQRITRLLACLLACMLLLCACQDLTDPPGDTDTDSPASVSSTLTVYFLSIGKADCVLLQTENHLVIIDAGESDNGKDIAEAVELLGAEKVDCLILTHPDKDHIGGAPAILATGLVEAVYQADYDKGSSEQRKLNSSIASSTNTTAITVTRTVSFVCDEVKYTVYPTALSYKGDDTSNEHSLGVLVEHGNNRMFFAGDALGERLTEMVSQIPDPGSIDLLKVPHHGRFDRNSDALIRALSPADAIICCAKSELPDKRVLSLLDEEHSHIHLTCYGLIVAVSDGNQLHIED